MIPDGYPDVLGQGIEALHWAVALQDQLLRHVAQLEGPRPAMLQPPPDHFAVLDTRRLADSRREIMNLTHRLKNTSGSEWASGYAAGIFTPVDLGLIETCALRSVSVQVSEAMITSKERQFRAAQLYTLLRWLAAYLKANPFPD